MFNHSCVAQKDFKHNLECNRCATGDELHAQFFAFRKMWNRSKYNFFSYQSISMLCKPSLEASPLSCTWGYHILPDNCVCVGGHWTWGGASTVAHPHLRKPWGRVIEGASRSWRPTEAAGVLLQRGNAAGGEEVFFTTPSWQFLWCLLCLWQ